MKELWVLKDLTINDSGSYLTRSRSQAPIYPFRDQCSPYAPTVGHTQEPMRPVKEHILPHRHLGDRPA